MIKETNNILKEMPKYNLINSEKNVQWNRRCGIGPVQRRYLNLRPLHKAGNFESKGFPPFIQRNWARKNIFIRKTRKSVSDIPPKGRGKFPLGSFNYWLLPHGSGFTFTFPISLHACACSVAKLCLMLLWLHGLYPTRLLCPQGFPGKNKETSKRGTKSKWSSNFENQCNSSS